MFLVLPPFTLAHVIDIETGIGEMRDEPLESLMMTSFNSSASDISYA